MERNVLSMEGYHDEADHQSTSAECTCVLTILEFNNADGDDGGGDGDIPRPQCRVITLIAMAFVLYLSYLPTRVKELNLAAAIARYTLR